MFAMSRISNGCYSPEHEEGDEQRVVASSLVSLNRRKQRAQGITHHRLRVQYHQARCVEDGCLYGQGRKEHLGTYHLHRETGNSS